MRGLAFLGLESGAEGLVGVVGVIGAFKPKGEESTLVARSKLRTHHLQASSTGEESKSRKVSLRISEGTSAVEVVGAREGLEHQAKMDARWTVGL